MPLIDDLMRHVRACQSFQLSGRVPFRTCGSQVGWIDAATAEELHAMGGVEEHGGISLEPQRLQPVARALADRGRFRWRDEAFDVRVDHDGDAAGTVPGKVLGTVDRGALPLLGIRAWGAHCNGLVRRDDGWHLWVARRAADRPLDPGKLDHLAAGGVPAGLTPEQTLAKEAEEEAGIPASLSAQARRVATLGYSMDREEGLRRDRLACFDLLLPDSFQPVPHDDEIESFALWPLPDVLERVRTTDDFKFNVNLVLIDLFLREGLLGHGQTA